MTGTAEPEAPAIATNKRPRLSHVWGREAADHYVEPVWVSARLFETEDFDRSQILLECLDVGRHVHGQHCDITMMSCQVIYDTRWVSP